MLRGVREDREVSGILRPVGDRLGLAAGVGESANEALPQTGSAARLMATCSTV